jgi:hypothetical protein
MDLPRTNPTCENLFVRIAFPFMATRWTQLEEGQDVTTTLIRDLSQEVSLHTHILRSIVFSTLKYPVLDSVLGA